MGVALKMFQLLSGIPDYCSSTGCLVGQVQMFAGKSAKGRQTQLSELPMRRTPGIPEQVLASDRPRKEANAMPGGCPVFELSSACIPTDTGALHLAFSGVRCEPRVGTSAQG